MSTWSAGRESSHLDDILLGKKTVEGRLARGKFAQYAPGDVVYLRRDIRAQDGTLHDGEPDQARVRVLAVNRYLSFREMLKKEGLNNVLPRANSLDEAVAEYERHYTRQEHATYGVLGIVIELL